VIIISGEGSAADASTADQYLPMCKAVPALTHFKDLREVVLLTGGGRLKMRDTSLKKICHFSSSTAVVTSFRYASSKHLIIVGTGTADHPSLYKEAVDSGLTSRRFHPVQGYLFVTVTSL
jgi:hypothetical protein